MKNAAVTERDKKMAQKCVGCYVCKKARVNQKGFFFWFVQEIDERICPFCKAYEKVYGRKASAKVPK